MPQSRNALNLRGFKLLLLALLAAAVALAAITLSAGAQTPGGGSESDSTETVQGHIIARVQDTTGEDGVDDYRVEFGFFPEWAMTEAESWSDAIAPRSSWLPSSRFLTKSAIDARVAADNRAWLRSSLISVPAQSAQSPGGDSTQIIGRVIARYNPDSEGRLRVEFGFVPEWAFTDTSTTEQAVERLGASNLPSARYLRVAAIDASRGVWLRSSAIDVPLRAPVVVIETVQPPAIDSLSCTPSSPTVDESITCKATLSGDTPDSYAWSGGASNGSGATYSTSFSTSGSKTISLTVANTAGRDTGSTTLTVVDPLQPPVIDSLDCTPSSPTVDESITCTATLSGDAPDSYAWSGGGGSGDSDSHTISLSKAGDYTISLTVANSAGSDTDSITLIVYDELQPPIIDAINCTPELPIVNHGVYCIPSLSGGAPDTYDWGYGVGPVPWQPTLSISFGKLGEQSVSLTVANAAGSDTHSITLTIGGRLAPVIDDISCSPASPTVDDPVECTADLSGGEPVSWSWSGGAESGSSAAYNTSFSSAGSKTVSLTVTNAGGSATDSISLAAFDSVQAPVIDSVSCSPSSPAAPVVNETVTCTADLSGGEPESWAWSGGVSTGSGATYTTSFSKAGDYTVSLAVANTAGRDTGTFALTVVATLQPPVVDSITCTPSDPPVNDPVKCTADLSGGTPSSYAWSGGRTAGAAAIYDTNFGDAGDATVSLTVTNAAGSSAGSTSVAVNGYPQCSWSGTRQFTVGQFWSGAADAFGDGIVTCTDLDMLTYTLSSSDSSVLRVSENMGVWTVEAVAPGTAYVHITVADPGGLSYTVDLFVTVAAGVQAPVIDRVSCSPASPAINDAVKCTAAISGGDPTSYSWSGGASNGSGSTYNTSFDSAGAKTISLTVANAAGSGSSSAPVTVGSSVANRPPICNGGSASMSRGDARTFDWCFDPDGDTLTYTLSSSDPSVVSVSESNGVWTRRAVADGSARLSFTATDPGGLSDQASIEVLVLDPPSIVSIDCTPSQPVVNETVTCTAELSGTTPDYYRWRGGASDGSDPTYTTSYSKAGNRPLSLEVRYRAFGSMKGTGITVREGALTAPVIDGITCSPAAPAVGDTMTCSAALSGGAPTSWSWSGGAGGTGKTHAASFSSSGNKTVSLTVSNSAGSDTESITVVVEDSVQLPVIDAISCSPSAAEVNERVVCTATLSGGAPDSYTWSGGISDGADETYSTRFDSAGTATVSLTVTNLAGSVNQSITVAVNQGLQSPVIRSISCSSQSPGVGHSVTCTANLSGGPPTAYAWSGGASNGSDATYSTSFAAAGRATVSLTVTNAAGSDNRSTSLTVKWNVQAPIIEAITCSPSLPTVNQGVACTARLSGGQPDSYHWGAGRSPGEIYSFSSAKTGDETISLTVTNAAGSDTHSITVTIGGRLAPVIDGISCSPASPTVDDPVECTASLSGGDPVSWSWSGGASSGSSAAYSTSFSSAGGKTVSLTVTNGGGSATDSISLTAFDSVQAPVIDSVSCSPSSPSAPVVNETVTCTASLSGGAPDSYAWSGGASTGAGATYTTSFSAAGEATVSLAVTNAAGSDTGSFTLTVVAALQAPVVDSITCTPSDPPVNDPVKCTAGLSGGTPNSYAWSGGRAASTATTYATDFGDVGAATISLTVTNAAGSGTGSTTVTANGYPQCDVSVSIQRGVGESEALSSSLLEQLCTDQDSLTYTVNSSSDSSVASVSESDGVWTVRGVGAGHAQIHVTATDPGGLTARASISVRVVAPVQAPVIDKINCWPTSPTVGDHVECGVTQSGGVPHTYAWSSGASRGASGNQPLYDTSFSTSGDKTVSLTVTNSAGSDTKSISLTVIAASTDDDEEAKELQPPVIDSLSCTPSSPRVAQSVFCAPSLSGGIPYTWAWSFNSEPGPRRPTLSFSSYAVGSQTISLTVTNSAGSDSASITLTIR